MTSAPVQKRKPTGARACTLYPYPDGQRTKSPLRISTYVDLDRPCGRVSQKGQQVGEDCVQPSLAQVPLHQQPPAEAQGSVACQRESIPAEWTPTQAQKIQQRGMKKNTNVGEGVQAERRRLTGGRGSTHKLSGSTETRTHHPRLGKAGVGWGWDCPPGGEGSFGLNRCRPTVADDIDMTSAATQPQYGNRRIP